MKTSFRLLLAITLLACDGGETTAVADAVPPPATPAAPVEVKKEEPPKKPAERRILSTVGEVKLDGQPAVAGAEIGPTSLVQTGADGTAVITLQPGSVIEIRPKTEVRLGTSERKSISAKLVFGALWNILPKGKASYEVVTDNAVAGVRGTTFYIEAQKPNETYVCACDGELAVQAGEKKAKDVVSHAQHIGTRIVGKGKKAKAVPMPKNKVLGHTKEQAAELGKMLAEVPE